VNSILLYFGGKAVSVFGGPYVHRPTHMTGIKLAVEINLPCDIDLPIVDYSVPDVAATKRVLLQTIKRLSKGETLYAGCWGGMGRTGLFLALLAKVAGVSDPVSYVRSSYHPHAVETPEQKKYVADFPVFWLKWAYRVASQVAKSSAVAEPSVLGGKNKM
jgi:protein-tyrosine phosphatase